MAAAAILKNIEKSPYLRRTSSDDVGQGNVNSLQHLQSDRRDGARAFLKPIDSVLFK